MSRRPENYPDFKYCNIKLALDLIERLTVAAQREERTLAREVSYRLRKSLAADQADDHAAA